MSGGAARRRHRRLWRKDWPDHAALRAQVRITVPFHDADPDGVAWHGNYFRYYDAARTALLATLRLGYAEVASGAAGRKLWPIVDTRVRYRRSMPYGTVATVSAQLVEWTFRMVIYYEIRDTAGTLLNEAYTIQVPVSTVTASAVLGTPEVLRARVRELISEQENPEEP